MSKYLAIDTSSRYLTVLAVNGEKTVLRRIEDCAMRHSVILMDEIDAALSEAALAPAECDFFAAVTGPGSFTGIRIGVAAVKGFASAADKPLLSITSFDLIAYNVNRQNFAVAIDAAHGFYYVCGYGEGLDITLSPRYISGEEVEALNLPVYGFEELDLNRYTRLDAGDCLTPAVERGRGGLSDKMCALYVRKSQAEENLNKKR